MSTALSQMRRVDELEAHLAVKKRELQTLQKEIAERQANFDAESAAARSTSAGNDTTTSTGGISTASGQKLPKPSIGENFVVQSALADRSYLEYLPLYEAHNATTTLRAAIEVEAQQVQLLKREIANLSTEYQLTQTRTTKAINQYGEFKRITGFSDDKTSIKHPVRNVPIPRSTRGNNNNNNGSQEGDSSSAAAPNSASNKPTHGAAKFTASARNTSSLTETPAQRGERQNKELADQYILELRKVEEHLKASHLLKSKLETSLRELSRADYIQHETEMKVDLAKNDLLVLEREIALRQAELLDLREMQGGCDGEMQKIDTRRVKEQKLLDMIANEYRRVKGEVSDVAEQKRQWEETIKAQDRRLGELRERKQIIDQAVEDHQIKKFVDQYVETVTAQRQQQQQAQEDAQDESGNAAVNPSENLSDIISHYADVNMLSPPEEVVPSGVVTLLTSLHDKLAHRVRCKEVLLEEKHSSADALHQRVADLVAIHDDSEDKLYIARGECEKEVQVNMEAARQQLAEFRDEYNALKSVSIVRQRQERHASISKDRAAQPLPEMKFKDKKTK